MVKLGFIGVGDWGRNLVRNFSSIKECDLFYCCDLKDEKLSEMTSNYPRVKVTKDYRNILDNKDVDAVVIASPSPEHYKLAKDSLLAGKHVFVEKPLTLKTVEAEDLVETADMKKLILMVGHLMVYHPGIDLLKDIIGSEDFGKIYYMYSQRVNLGKVRPNENALWSFAPHDVSVILHLLDKEPVSVSAKGECYLQDGIQDVVFLYLRFTDRTVAHVQLSWLDPHKERKLTVVGSKKMVVFDDMGGNEKVKIYDKGAVKKYDSYGEYLSLRFGDIVVPKVDMKEPLKIECGHFIDCIINGKTPKSSGIEGVRVVKILEAAEKSLMNDGAMVDLKDMEYIEV